MTSLPMIPSEHSLSSRACRFVLAEPAGTYAEAVRSSCRELEKRRAGAPSRLILIVSALANEGAECLASNIAHQYALAGHASLLIDADLRAKTLTHELARDSARGLLDQIATHQPIENAILRDCATGLHFLPASGPAPIPLAAKDVLRGKALGDAIATLKQSFVTIVMTAPPLLAATDATILAELADEIVFVTAWQKTPRRLAQKALATIRLRLGDAGRSGGSARATRRGPGTSRLCPYRATSDSNTCSEGVGVALPVVSLPDIWPMIEAADCSDH
jgi:Mrp family chromosome partitioning ATPase